MTTQLPSNNHPIMNTSSYLLPIAVLSTSFFMSTAMAAGGSTDITSIQSVSTNTTATPSTTAPAIQSITPTATAECPLNSGGPSLLGTTWVLETLYGNRVPHPLKMDMRVSTHALSGKAGCNKYSATFNRVGYTGFKVRQIVQTKKKCEVLIPYKTAKSIDVGRLEGSYLRILRRMGSVRQMDNGKLQFFDRNGKVGLVLRKIADENKQAQAAPLAPTPKKVVAPKVAQQQAIIKKAVPAQQQKVAPQKAEEQQPIIRKINTSDDDLISNFFKKIGF